MSTSYQDSSVRYEDYPEARHEALRRYQEAVRRLIAVSGIIDPEPAALDAVSATLEAQAAALEQLDRGRPFLRFRAGVPGDDPNSAIPFSPISGRYNPMAPPVEFTTEGQVLVGTVRFNDAYEGPNGCVHGSIVASVYDQMLALANVLAGLGGPTGSLTIRYLKPTPLHEELRFEAWTGEVNGRKITAHGRCLAGDVVVTESEGLFISLDPNRGYPQWSNRTRSGDASQG